MKYIYTATLLLALPFCTIAQNAASNQFPSQLKKILTEAASGFKSFRKELVHQDGPDVVYASKINLQGTSENKINSFSDGSSYMATISSVPSERQAKTLVESWKSKLTAILGKGFEVLPYKNNDKKALREGYFFMGEQLTVSIDYINYESEQNYNVYLVVLNQ